MAKKKSKAFQPELGQPVLQQTPEGVFCVNSAGLFQQANSRFCELVGHTEQELQSLHICDVATDWHQALWTTLWQRFVDDGVLHYKGGLQTNARDVIAVEFDAGLLKLSGEKLMCAFVHELGGTGQRRAQLKRDLEGSEAEFRTLYNNVPVMLQACDHETKIYSVNNYWLETLGYELDEVLGRQTREFMTESSRNAVIHQVIPVLLETGNIHDFEYQLVKKNGEAIDVALTAVSDLDENGRLIRTLSMILPISDRKRAERLESQNFYLREEIIDEFNSSEIVGTSPPMRELFHNIEMVADTDSTVLLLGETGTGKELVARAIHQRSNRKSGIMVKVNCGALPPNLVESELFGHEKGAFTGATARKRGRFELANKSTIFLDEVGELPPETQTKLLRVLQEQELERVGGLETVKVDVRVIAATNRDLEEEVKKGHFRADLFYRLNIFPIKIPPLRDRIEDIPLLANHFVDRFAARLGKKITSINREAIEKLISWHWPGNVRELANILERAVILCRGNALRAEHIGLSSIARAPDDRIPTLEESERRLIILALQKCNGRLSGPKGAATLLGINRSTLWSRIQKHGIHVFKRVSG